MAAYDKDELAQLVTKCVGKSLVTVEIVDKAYNMLCDLVKLERELADATTNKNETALTTAIAEAGRSQGCVRAVYILRGNQRHNGYLCHKLTSAYLFAGTVATRSELLKRLLTRLTQS